MSEVSECERTSGMRGSRERCSAVMFSEMPVCPGPGTWPLKWKILFMYIYIYIYHKEYLCPWDKWLTRKSDHFSRQQSLCCHEKWYCISTRVCFFLQTANHRLAAWLTFDNHSDQGKGEWEKTRWRKNISLIEVQSSVWVPESFSKLYKKTVKLSFQGRNTGFLTQSLMVYIWWNLMTYANE